MGSKRVAFRPAARVGVIASSLALLAMLISPNAAFAATTIGSAVGDVTCNLPLLDSVQLSSSDPTISYTVPAGGGVIDSWNAQSTGLTGRVGLQVWRRTTTTGTYLLVGASSLATPTGAAMPVAPAIPVMAGDLIGLHIEGSVACGHGTNSGLDTWAYGFGPTPTVLTGTEVLGPPSGSFRLNVSANVTTAVAPPGTGCDSSGASSGDDKCDNSKTGKTHTAADKTADKAAERAIVVTAEKTTDRAATTSKAGDAASSPRTNAPNKRRKTRN